MVKLFLKTQSFKVSVNCPKDVQQTTTTTAITNKANKQKTFVQENLLKLRKNSENLWHLDVLPIPLPTLLSLMVETLFQAGSDRIPSSCRSQSRLLVSPQEGQATSISHLPQLCVAEAKFQVSVAKKSGFSCSTQPHRVEVLLQVWHTESPAALTVLTTAHL